MISRLSMLPWLLLCLLILIPQVSAFGAGEVPAGSDFKGYVWRHGDICEALLYLPSSFITNHRFTQLERKQIYFGNWLRDFSQVIDTTLLETVNEAILRAIVSVMGFLEFGFATDEFDVTRERLGVYTHVEHIDNPAGYADDAKKVDERLRGPVDPRELEFDPETGMKNYIANSGQGWATSADYIREQLSKSIELGRLKRDTQAKKESRIHLGAALHTLEDFSAHSNFIELCLHELGEEQVFPFVGDACRIEAPRRWKHRKVAPLVTGTFGMLDIFHSLLGEADDIAVVQTKGSLGELEKKLGYGGVAFEQLYDLIKNAIEVISKVGHGDNPLLKQLETVGLIFNKMKENSPDIPTIPKPISGDNDESKQPSRIDDVTNPTFLWQAIEPVFYLHDRISKWMQESAQESGEIGVSESRSQLGEETNQLVFQFLTVMIESAVKELRNAVKAAKEKVDEEAAKSTAAAVYQAGSSASDPSHSDLSKDHFSNVLNQVAGLVATVTTNWTTQQVVKCWDDPTIDADKTIDQILTILHHPAFPTRKTKIQQYMFEEVEKWWRGTSASEKDRLRRQLTRESVEQRGHEDHNLDPTSLITVHRGAAEFPGSRPGVIAPPRKASFPLTWALNEAAKDLKKILSIMKRGIRDPAGAAGEILNTTGNLAIGSGRIMFGMVGWLARKLPTLPWRSQASKS
ncbi:heterokaryon incompatibility Het-C [Xylaria bambusicola]|uniref:heterokaryon incompatibility Het-C n=1 Tax=Xylaria bambusicola TaxID=326684 RepID=UPI002007E261|nr:heterokaryon incompatibility Het-C [Xylaria bambusicola]KAI0518307.1 heterokaryon incompatibility Het-C [Xylaria bambusicola]